MRELDCLLAELQMDDAHVCVEHPLQLVIFAANDAKIRDFLESQHFREELHFPVHVADGEADRFDPLHVAGQSLPAMA